MVKKKKNCSPCTALADRTNFSAHAQQDEDALVGGITRTHTLARPNAMEYRIGTMNEAYTVGRTELVAWLNRLLGFLFAAAKVVLILSVIVYIIDYIYKAWNLIPESLAQGSLFYSSFLKISKTFFPYLQGIIG